MIGKCLFGFAAFLLMFITTLSAGQVLYEGSGIGFLLIPWEIGFSSWFSILLSSLKMFLEPFFYLCCFIYAVSTFNN